MLADCENEKKALIEDDKSDDELKREINIALETIDNQNAQLIINTQTIDN